jgi:hypothetical protein
MVEELEKWWDNPGKVEKSGEFVFLFDRLYFFFFISDHLGFGTQKLGGKNIPARDPKQYGGWVGG